MLNYAADFDEDNLWTCLSYHICSLIFFPSNSIVLILKSIPEENKSHINCLLEAPQTLPDHPTDSNNICF